MHILRNSIDHGIEKNETRIESGKNPKGKIHFRAYYSGNYVHIEVTDDGAGINLEKVRQTAIIKGYITENQQLTEKEILDLTFYQGFTTTDKVSAVSGRGVGMDVVKRDVSNLRGEIEVSTQKGQGTKILIKIPLSLSIIDTMLVVVAETYFAIPLLYVANCWRTTQNELDSSTDKHITINNERIPYVELRKVFKIGDEAPSRRRVVVVKTGDFAAAFLVDRIIGEHQAVLKPLGKYFADYDYLSGVSLLADGSLAMIIEAGKIIYDHTRNLSTV